jgi:hypothetical protein
MLLVQTLEIQPQGVHMLAYTTYMYTYGKAQTVEIKY